MPGILTPERNQCTLYCEYCRKDTTHDASDPIGATKDPEEVTVKVVCTICKLASSQIVRTTDLLRARR